MASNISRIILTEFEVERTGDFSFKFTGAGAHRGVQPFIPQPIDFGSDPDPLEIMRDLAAKNLSVERLKTETGERVRLATKKVLRTFSFDYQEKMESF